MTRTGTPELWAVGEPFGVVPCPPDSTLAALLADWWTLGSRTFGCASARGGPWVVVAPSPDILCPVCAADVFARERRCVYCGRRTRPNRGVDLLFEMRGEVRVVARAHVHCQESAARKGARS